jgi:uncharacterized protein (DUF2164 family)
MKQENKTTISEEKKELLKKELIDYFATEKDIEIGEIAALEIIDFFLEKLDKEIYNQALDDAKTAARQGMENTILNIDLLTKL